MNNIVVVKVYKPEKYSLNQQYGILIQSMQDTALVNFTSNTSGLCVNIAHSDYGVVSPNSWKVFDNEIEVKGPNGYITTGLELRNF